MWKYKEARGLVVSPDEVSPFLPDPPSYNHKCLNITQQAKED